MFFYLSLILGTIFGAIFVVALMAEGRIYEGLGLGFGIFLVMAVAKPFFAILFPFVCIGMLILVAVFNRE